MSVMDERSHDIFISFTFGLGGITHSFWVVIAGGPEATGEGAREGALGARVGQPDREGGEGAAAIGVGE